MATATLVVETPVSETLAVGTDTGVVCLASEFAQLVSGSNLSEGTSYFVSDVPALWLAVSASSYIGLYFELSGTSYIGDEALAAQTEVDLAAGTWDSRPLTGFDSGVMYYRRMTDVGNCSPIMTWLGGTSTAWTPLNGEQKVYSLLADTYHATADGTERVNGNAQFALNANLLALDGMGLKLVFSSHKSAAAESPEVRLRFGAAGSSADSLALGNWTMATTTRNFAQTIAFKRASSTTLQVQGAGTITATGHRFGNSTTGARLTALSGLDFTVANYLSMTVAKTTPFAENMVTDVFDVWLTGR